MDKVDAKWWFERFMYTWAGPLQIWTLALRWRLLYRIKHQAGLQFVLCCLYAHMDAYCAKVVRLLCHTIYDQDV